MSRNFDPSSLVRLPALDALATQALGTAMLAAAADKTLPVPVAEAIAYLKTAVDTLQTAATERLPARDPVVRAADIDLDAAWGALSGLLSALSRVPNHVHADLAAQLRAQLFPDGLRFTLLPVRREWAESTIRLQVIDERGLAPQIEQLGGTVVLAQLRQAHARYGEVLNVTVPAPEPTTIGIREARAAVLKALRLLVIRVTASVRAEDPASADLARDLLAPIATYERPARAKPAADQPPPAPPPPSPPLPSTH